MTLGQKPRVNPVGIQYLSSELHSKVFPRRSADEPGNVRNTQLLLLAQDHLRKADLLGKKTQLTVPIVVPNLPELVGQSTLDEHFTRIGARSSKPYNELADSFLHNEATVPPLPKTWKFQLGWTRYTPGEKPQRVYFPLEDALVFDVEVLYKLSHYPAIAAAASNNAWYAWVSPVLTDYTENGPNDFEHLIPMATHSRPKLLVGYNVSYDRARVMEEYNVKQSKAFFLDAMALHISVSGFCSQQRPLWHAHRKRKSAVEQELDLERDSEVSSLGHDSDGSYFSAQDIAQELMDDPWLNKGTTNSLANVAEFHCGIRMDKDARDSFSSNNPQLIIDNFQKLMTYCATDVEVTFKVTQKLLPEFRKKNPHPVSFAALKLLGTLFCPTTTNWKKYIEKAESVYQENRKKVGTILRQRAEELVVYIKSDEAEMPNIENDPWLMHLNWKIKEARFRRDGTPFARKAFLTGYPEWYRELFKAVKDKGGELTKELNLSVRTRVTPYLLRLKWEGYPLVWTNTAGWCFKVPANDVEIERLVNKKYIKLDIDPEKYEDVYSLLREGTRTYELFRVPHPEGPKRRCTSIMTKNFLKYFESGELSSEYEYVSEILNLNATASYWMGNRARIMDQFVVYSDPKGKKNCFFDSKAKAKANKDVGMIIPKFCTMGTVTRRATENTWLTASNSKSNRIGSELKAMVESPKDYAFVGADVDSEELWIASLIGDSMFHLHGGTALGWMTLEGDKNDKTDLHSRTAEIMSILRNDAKVFNYGRIYGAGVKFATQLLRKCSTNLTDEEAAQKAQDLYSQTKGLSSYSRVLEKRLYHGGTESVMFNALEAIAQNENPRTPVLGASITDALTRKHLNKNSYLTSRVNWAIQSSGVDYLHLLIVSMEYLIEKYGIDARLMITVHDELRYMVRKDQSLECGLLLQISNLWTRAMFCEQMGIHDVPQSCAFFSEVDIDHVLRKEVAMNCVTPSHPEEIPPGRSYTIQSLLDSFDVAAFLSGKQKTLNHLKSMSFKPRVPVMETFNADLEDAIKVAALRLQTAVDKTEWTNLTRTYTNAVRKLLFVIPEVDLTGSQSLRGRGRERTEDTEIDIAQSQMAKKKKEESQKPKRALKTAKSALKAKKEPRREVMREAEKEQKKESKQKRKEETKEFNRRVEKAKAVKADEIPKKKARYFSTDDNVLLSKEGDLLLMAELESARLSTGSARKKSQDISFNGFHPGEPFARSDSGSKRYSTQISGYTNSAPKICRVPLFSKNRFKVSGSTEGTSGSGLNAPPSRPVPPSLSSSRPSATSLNWSKTFVGRIGRRTQIPKAAEAAFTGKQSIISRSNSVILRDKPERSSNRTFRRRINGVSCQSEYRFGRSHQR